MPHLTQNSPVEITRACESTDRVREVLTDILSVRSPFAIIIDLTDACPATHRELRSLLRDSELVEANSFATQADEYAYVCAHALLHLVIPPLLGGKIATWQLEYRATGAPWIMTDQDFAPNISLSHTLGMAALAVSCSCPVGIDVEAWDTSADLGKTAKRIMSTGELALYSSDERIEHFYAVWTRKEALLKALGSGITRRLDAYDTSDVLQPTGPEIPASGATLSSIAMPAGHSGAICVLSVHETVKTMLVRHHDLRSIVTTD